MKYTREQIAELRKKGLTIRAIQKELHISSPSVVQYHLTYHKKSRIMCCWECGEGLKIAYDTLTIEGDNATFYFCDNQKCLRYGLASVVWKVKIK